MDARSHTCKSHDFIPRYDIITRAQFNIKMSSYQYRKSNCGDKTILWPSYLHNGISYTGKTTSLYWIRPRRVCTWPNCVRDLTPGPLVTKKMLFCRFRNPIIKLRWSDNCPRFTLGWRHNDHAGVSNHQPHGCLLNRLFRRNSKKTSKLRVTGLCAGNSPGTGEFPAQMASYAENVFIWWRHHDNEYPYTNKKMSV